MQNDDTDKSNPPGSGKLDISEYIPGHDLKNGTAGEQTSQHSAGEEENGRKRLAVERAFREDAAAGMQSKRKRTSPWEMFLSLLVILLIMGLFPVWFVGTLIIGMGSLHKGFYFPLWSLFLLSLGVCLFTLLSHARKLRNISACVILACVLGFFGFRAWTWWTVDRYPVVKEVDWRQYRPFEEGNKLVKVEIPAEYALNAGEGYPRLDGAYALYPIYAAMAQGMYPENIATNRQFLCTDGSDYVYGGLLNGGSDLVFALAPSKQQQEVAEKTGLEYELTPFCKDAFVFYVNAKNPVDNLTTEQIKGIYSGRITDWKEVGAPFSTKIIPFQRNEGSGSQTTLQKLMGDTPIMPPLKEDRLGGMGDIINDTANYRNYKASLGFSFRYYSTELLRNDQIKLLSIDGIAPTVENIRNGTYPLVATAYMVTVRPRSENTRKIVDFMLSPEGQKLVEDTGYVSLGTPTPPAR
ncbi:MAG: substrate-binding domain-containing protein [Lentisphaeria bacterium]|nr:substrate-binding domain-containing protein [Lentisphaeria bacterium]